VATVPNHYERQLMQRLRGRGWVKAAALPSGPKIIKRLLEKRWIECEGTGRDIAFRMTEKGLVAKSSPIPLRR
jgi:hypothetical protein